jgi:hypothetical protein
MCKVDVGEGSRIGIGVGVGKGEGEGGGEGEGEGGGEGEGEGGGEGEGEGDGEGEGEGDGEAREKVVERAMRCKVEVIVPGMSQPTLALGRQTSNCHAGQDWREELTSDSSGLLSSEEARCLLASSGRPPSEHWTMS